MDSESRYDVEVHYIFSERAAPKITALTEEKAVERGAEPPRYIRYPAPNSLIPSEGDLVELLDIAPGLPLICQGRKLFFSPHGQRIEVVLDLFDWTPPTN